MTTTVTADVSTLVQHLAPLARVVPARSSNPLLTAVEVRATDEGLSVTGTDARRVIVARVPGQVATTPGSLRAPFLVPFRPLLTLLRRIARGTATLTHDPNMGRLTLMAGGLTLILPTDDTDRYPAFDVPRAGAIVEPRGWVRGLSEVLYASSVEAFQNVFRCVRVRLEGARTEFTASDGFRLAQAEAEGNDEWRGDDARELMVYMPWLKDAARGLARATGLQLHVGPEHLTLITPALTYHLPLELQGTYPDVSKVMGHPVEHQADLDAATLRAALWRVMTFANLAVNARTVLAFDADGRTLSLTCEGEYDTTTTERVDATHARADGTLAAFTTLLDARYLHQALAQFTRGTVRVHFTGPTSPATLTSADAPGSRAMLVPLRS